VKVGFHAGPAGNRDGLGEWMKRLDETGVPFFLKSVDDAGPIFDAQEIVRGSLVPHVLVYRRSGGPYEYPDYSLEPEEAAWNHWQLHKAAFPPELDPSLVWLETMNEVDKNRSGWLARFAIRTSELALADGFRWAAFGFASGEPEPEHWRSAEMLAFLSLVAQHPDRLAIALHEYSYDVNHIDSRYPYLMGRFQDLFLACDQAGIPRPTLLITEWGWEEHLVPDIGQAIRDTSWAAALYAPYPEIKGAGLWYLGGDQGNIADRAQRLIDPLSNYARGNYFAVPLGVKVPIYPDQHR